MKTETVYSYKLNKSFKKKEEEEEKRKKKRKRNYRIPGGIAEITATIKDLKDAGVVVPTTSPLNSILPVQKTDGSWGMTVDR
jgi:hypothetical protein